MPFDRIRQDILMLVQVAKAPTGVLGVGVSAAV
jgi:hypothetical protein